MNVTLSKILPTFLLKLKTDTDFKCIDSTGLCLELKRISIDNQNGSIKIPLTNTVVDLVNQLIIIKSDYIDDFNLILTAYEVDQIDAILNNYLNLLKEQITAKDLV